MSVTATYTYPNTTQRNYMGLAEVNGTLYTAINQEGIYSVNKSTGAVTQIYSEVKNWRVMAKVGSNLLCSQWLGALKLISTSGTLLKDFGTDSWFGACEDPSDSNVAYSCCYSKSSNQIAKLNISAGTVQYYTTANRTYCGIVCLGNYLYACENNGLIYKIDKTTFTETVFCNESRQWIDMKTDGTYLYSVVYSGQVRRIDVSTGVSEIILGHPAGDTTTRAWQCVEYSSTDKALWAGIYGWELWKLALPVPAVPTSSVSTSTIYRDTAVTLSCSTSGATIKYTTDGTTPSASNGTTYSAPFTISATTTIKFCAIKDGYLTAGADAVLTYADGVTATYTCPNTTQRNYIGLAEVNGTLYTAINYQGIYSVNKSTGAITQIYSEAADWLVMARVGSNLLCTQWNASLKLISTSGTLLKNFGTDSWWGACDDPSDSNVAYAICNKESNQLAKLNISAGTVQYYTITNREYRGIVCLGNYLYACVHMGLIYKIDKTTFTETVLCNESRVWVDMKTDGTYLYSVVSGGQVRRIDVSTGVSEIVLGDPAGDAANRPWQCLEYSSSDKAVWAGIYGWELWKLALPVPAVPTASVTSRFSTSLVTLSCSTSGATIKYTIDGSTPGLSNGTTYSSAITISQTTTLKFCAIKDGYVTAGSDVSVTVGSGLIGTYSILNATTRSYSAVGLWTQFYPDSNSTSGHKIYASYSAGGGNDTIAYLNSDGTTSQSATIPSVRGLSLYNMNLQSEVGQPVVISATYGGVARGVSELDSGGSGWVSSSTNNWSAVCVDDQILYPSGTVNTPVGYACCYGVGTLGVYDRATTTWTYKTITSRNYTGITSIGDYLYLSVDNGYVYKINKATLATTTLCSDSRAWTGLTNDGTYLYASVNNGNIYRINISTGVSEIILGDTSGDTTTRKWKGVVYSRRDNCLYAVVNGGALWKIDLYGAKAPYAIGAIDSKERKYNIQIFSETSGVSIRYTIDGSVPSAINGSTYTGVFSVTSNCTVKYCAIKDGMVVYGGDLVISFNPLYIYDESNNSWKLVTIPYISNAGAWKQTNAIYEMVSGVWTRIY